MKTPIIITIILILCFRIQSAAQGDPETPPFKNFDSALIQLSKSNIPLTGTAQGDCSTPPNTIIGGKKDIDLPYLPPSDNEGSVAPPQVDGDINIYFIHGLNGSVESLRVLAKVTEFGSSDGTFVPRKAHSVIGLTGGDQTYLENNGIEYTAIDMNNVANSLAPVYPHTPKDYIIAHSQGGIVAREWLRDMDEKPGQFQNYAHGLVTFGTSHAGARILNTTRPDLQNRAPAFFGEACQALSKAMISDKVKNSFLLKMLLTTEMSNRFVGTACEFFSSTVVPFALDNYHKATTLDYYVGAPFLTKPSKTHPTGLSNYELKVPVVQFYGEEEQPIMWRFFSSMMDLGKDQSLQAGNSTGEFIYDKDDQLQGRVSNLMNDFKASYNDAETKYQAWKVTRLGSIFIGGAPLYALAQKLEKVNKDLMDNYNGAIVWLANANDYYLTDLVGARDVHSVKYCMTSNYTSCMDLRTTIPTVTVTSTTTQTAVPSGGSCNTYISSRQYSPNSYTACTETNQVTSFYRNEYYYKPNDGVVLAESASSPLKGAPGTSHKYERMNATNHDQMKNSKPTRTALNRLYDGQLGGFFKVDPR
jgi:hypothetical protein